MKRKKHTVLTLLARKQPLESLKGIKDPYVHQLNPQILKRVVARKFLCNPIFPRMLMFAFRIFSAITVVFYLMFHVSDLTGANFVQ